MPALLAFPCAMAESDLLKAIETVDDWVNICGDDATKDMLYIVETYAAWCGPSQAALSTYRKIKEQNEQKKFKLCKVCADLSDEFNGRSSFDLQKYKIQPRPTFILFKDGEQVAIVEGVSMPTLEKCASTPPRSPHLMQTCSHLASSARSCPAPFSRAAPEILTHPLLMPRRLQADRGAHARGFDGGRGGRGGGRGRGGRLIRGHDTSVASRRHGDSAFVSRAICTLASATAHRHRAGNRHAHGRCRASAPLRR